MKTLLAGAVCLSLLYGGHVLAQDKKAAAKADPGFSQKVVHEDDRIRVNETTYKAGASGSMTQRPARVVRVLNGGTLERTYADGKKEKNEMKTGETRVLPRDAQAYSNRNIGKTDVQLFSVHIKEAKK